MRSDHPEGPPHPPADVSDRSGQTLGDFVLLRQLGAGGMGQVYLAEQSSLKRRVAVKILRGDLASNEVSRKRFRAEAEAVARLSHANIVQLYQFHDETIPHYMVLEYVDGRNLRDFLARKGPPDLPLALSIMWQVTSALQQAAELGIVHRDIKPENILLTKKGEVKVADFGLSRMLLANSDAKHLTQTGITMGTPLYMAPEQVEGKPTDHRTDIYSLGVTCYHLLAGQPPFEGENAFAVALQHVQREPVPLEAMRPDLPPSLCALVHKMLAKKPEDRPQSAGEILRQLKLLTENTPGTRGDVALSALNLPTLPAPLDLEAAYAKTQVGTPPKPGRRRAWLLWPALVVGSLAVALGGGALTAMALRPPPEEPLADRPEAPNSTTLETLLGSYKRKERGYRDLIEETESPGRERENLRRGIQHRIDLGLLYLDQVPRDLDRAEELFAAQQKSKVREYEQIGRLGMAMVHAFRDEPEKSNQLLMESLAQSRETGPLALGPNLRWLRMLLAAMDYNKRNCQAQKLRYPPELLAYEAGLRRVPGVPPVPPPAVPSVPERPRQP